MLVILAIKTTNRFDFYVFSDVNLSLLGLEMFIMISHDSHFNDVCLFLYSVFKVPGSCMIQDCLHNNAVNNLTIIADREWR